MKSLKLTMIIPMLIFAAFFISGMHAFYNGNQEVGLRLWGGVTLMNAIVAIVEFCEKRGILHTHIWHGGGAQTLERKDQLIFSLLYSAFALICMVGFFELTKTVDPGRLLLLMLILAIVGFVNFIPAPKKGS